MRYLFLLSSLFLAFLVKADITHIPRHDLKNITYLFKDLIDEHDYAYTIFGSKPMSLADFCLEPPPNLPFHRKLRSKFLMFKRKSNLNSWYKYRDEFDLKDFIFLDEEKEWLDCLVLVLINKKNMLQVLREHSSIFKKELGEKFTPETFLEKLEKKEESIATAINESQQLMGIMLGYGVRNATLFQDRCVLKKAKLQREKNNLPEDETITKLLADIEAQCGDFSEFEADAVIPPLYFLADVSHPETIRLKKTYEDDRQKIEALMKRPNFMDKVLRRLVD